MVWKPGVSGNWSRTVATLVVFLGVPATLPAGEPERPRRTRPGEPISSEAVEVGPADERGVATIRGRPASVPARSVVVVHTLDTGEFAATRADRDGRFSLEAFAPVGSVLQIHHRSRWPRPHEIDPDPMSSPAVVVDLAPKNPDPVGGEVAAAAVFPVGLARAVLRCKLSRVDVAPGEEIRIAGEISLVPIDGVRVRRSPRGMHLDFELARLFGEDGGALAPVRLLASAFLTPTGLPVEAPEDACSVHCGDCRIAGRDVESRASVLRAPVAARVAVPEELPAGHYVLGCRLGLDPDTFDAKRPWQRPFQEIQEFLPARLAILAVGRPRSPRMAVMLLSGMVSNGSRGVLPREDERRWALGPAAVFQAPVSVFPREFPDGRPVRFRFEPGLPLVSRANRPFVLTLPRPIVPLRFPGGQWSVTIRTPSGRVRRLGSSVFVAGRNNLNVLDSERVNPARDRTGVELAYGNNYLCDVYELTVADREKFAVLLEEDGRYRVETTGFVLDRFGHRYDMGGRFELVVARPFDVDLGLLPGTPLTTGDRVSPSVHVRPPMPAEVTIRFRHYPGSRADRMVERSLIGRANRAGYFAPAAPPVRFEQPGEYVMEGTVSCRDQQDRLWMASFRGASVVAPRKQVLIAHGERGLRSPESTQRLAWYIEGLRPDVVRKPGAGIHAVFPYHSGDVLWVEDHESIFPAVRFHDPTGRYAALVEKARPEVRRGTYEGFFNHDLKPIDMRAIGELPLFSRAAHGWPIGQFPDRAEYTSYAYTSTHRPGISVRSLVHESSFLAYWSLDDPYNLQFGGGPEGDLPNDIKLQFAGLVFRGPRESPSEPALPQYATYASMAVVVPRHDRLGNRVTPPFRGAGGGPNGGPLLTVRGRAHDLFVTPSGVLPGTVCQVGDRFVYSGYVWPPVPAEVRWSVRGPEGDVREARTIASRVGYFYDPDADFQLTEPGVHALRVRVTYRGVTSAGPVVEPFPAGDLLGTEGGLSHFVVVEPGEPPLDVDVSDLWSPPSQDGRLYHEALHRPVEARFAARVPRSWSEAEGRVTVWMPGFLLDDRRLAVAGSTFAYRFDAARSRRDFPNIDSQPVDTFLVTLAATGVDGDGERHTRARLVVIQGPRMWLAGPA